MSIVFDIRKSAFANTVEKLLDSYLNASSKWVPFESGVEPLADNILLNGQHVYDCGVVSTTYPPDLDHDPYAPKPDDSSACTGGRLYTTKVKPGTKLRLRLINASSFLSYWVSIDNHALTVVELDGVEIEPLAGQRGVYLNIGQRVSVVVDADQPPGNYLIRASLPQSCFLPYAPYTSAGLASVGYVGKGVLSYEGVAAEAPPAGSPGNTSNPFGVENNGARGDVWEGCDDMPFDVPKPIRRMDAVEVTEANTHYIEYMFRQAQDVNRIFINKVSQNIVSSSALSFSPPLFSPNALDARSRYLLLTSYDQYRQHMPPYLTTPRYGRCSTKASAPPTPTRTAAGTSAWTSRCCSYQTRTKGPKSSLILATPWNTPGIYSMKSPRCPSLSLSLSLSSLFLFFFFIENRPGSLHLLTSPTANRPSTPTAVIPSR